MWEQSQGRVYYGEGEEWQDWTDYLFFTTQNQDYAYAFAWVDDVSADFAWGFYNDRESLLGAFSEEKESMMQKEKNAVLWHFIKLRLDDDIYASDIYEYMEQNLPEEGYEYTAGPLYVEECAYCISQVSLEWHEEWHEDWREQRVITWLKSEAVVYDGYLYLLICDDDVTEENRPTMTLQLMHFLNWFGNYYNLLWSLDADGIYWIDHMQKVSRLENPERIFIEERAGNSSFTDTDWWKDYFGMLKEAEYQVQLSPTLPEMTIHFRFAGETEGDCYEIYLKDRSRNSDWYRMEVRMAEDGRLLQEKTVSLCVWKTDMISFEDLDEDGYLDMKVIYPEYSSKDDNLTVYDESYLLWSQETEEFEYIKPATLQARREENNIHPMEEEMDTDAQEMPYTLNFIVEDGDSLWRLAEKYYGDGERWWEIYEHNQKTIGDNPSLIVPGIEIEIP